MIIAAISIDTTQFTAQYELLRSQVVAAAGDAPQTGLGAQRRGVGLGLLLRDGMPGWLNAIDAVICGAEAQRPLGASTLPPAEPPAERSIAPPWLSGQCQDITALLTSLVLSTRRAERSLSPKEYWPCQ